MNPYTQRKLRNAALAFLVGGLWLTIAALVRGPSSSALTPRPPLHASPLTPWLKGTRMKPAMRLRTPETGKRASWGNLGPLARP